MVGGIRLVKYRTNEGSTGQRSQPATSLNSVTTYNNQRPFSTIIIKTYIKIDKQNKYNHISY
jgi:hypothetical protein